MSHELEFQKRKEKIDSFKKELLELKQKYNFGIHESDNYNGMEEHCGTDLYFIVDGDTYYSETIEEILDILIN